MRQWTREELEEFVRAEIQRTMDQAIQEALLRGPRLPAPALGPVDLSQEECRRLYAQASLAMPIIQRPEAMAVITADMMLSEPWPKELERSYTEAQVRACAWGLPYLVGIPHG